MNYTYIYMYSIIVILSHHTVYEYTVNICTDYVYTSVFHLFFLPFFIILFIFDYYYCLLLN